MKYKKTMLSLPEPLLKDIEHYARKVTNGNKSGFMAQAAEAYIKYLHRVEHTQHMREAYKASAKDSLRIAHAWRFIDAETTSMLNDEEGEKQNK